MACTAWPVEDQCPDTCYPRFVRCLRRVLHSLGCSSILALGCSGGTGSSATETTTGGTGSESETAGETGASAELQICHDLPEAAAAEWVEGEPLPAGGQSTAARISDAGDASWALAVDLLKAIPASEAASIAASPASMSIALGMTSKRHEGTMCASSIIEKMHAVESGEALHNTLGASIIQLESRKLAEGEDGEDPVNLSLKPSLWELSPGVSSGGDPLYGATRHTVNPGTSGENLQAIRTVMNCVIEVQSQGLLPDFLPADYPKPDTNAFDGTVAYLQAPWRYSLSTQGSKPFTRDGGATVDLEMIGTFDQELPYFDAPNFEAVSIPLRGGELEVLLVLPDASFTDLASFTDGLTPSDLTDATGGAAPVVVDLTFPKFKIAGETVDYYDPLALDCELFTLRTVLHGATVEIDEKGVKAAAASFNESWSTGTGPPPPNVTLTFDRPFLFFIYDQPTGFVLYSGRYAGD